MSESTVSYSYADPQETQAASIRRTCCLIGLAGALILGVGIWGLYLDWAWVAQPFYAYAWWGYIFILDAFVGLKRGGSLLTTRRHHFIPLFFGSVTFWYFFELLNLRFQNWYYVGVYENPLVGYPFSVLCFATVLIGMFETYDFVTALGVAKNWKGKPLKYPVWVSYAVQGLGALMAFLSVAFPTYLAPLIWGSLSFLLDPWNYRRGARSILRDFEHQDYGLVVRLLLAGLICGGVWESMNFFAPQKWIYTVRGLENFKLFEMPMLGFLGFPALAIDGMAFYSLLSYWFLGNESWERKGDLVEVPRPVRPPARDLFIKSIPLQLLFGALVLAGVRMVNVASAELRLESLPALTAGGAEVLRAEGISRPIRLIRESRLPERSEGIRNALEYSPEGFQSLLDEAELYSFKGIGSRHGRLLQEVGVDQVGQLAEWDPDELYETILEVAEQEQLRPPRLDMIRVWVFAARSRGVVLRTEA